MSISNEIHAELMNARMASAFDKSLDWLFSAEAAYCEHEWEDDGAGSPEDGIVSITCRKCGASHMGWM